MCILSLFLARARSNKGKGKRKGGAERVSLIVVSVCYKLCSGRVLEERVTDCV